jgi:hypothetical protein
MVVTTIATPASIPTGTWGLQRQLAGMIGGERERDLSLLFQEAGIGGIGGGVMGGGVSNNIMIFLRRVSKLRGRYSSIKARFAAVSLRRCGLAPQGRVVMMPFRPRLPPARISSLRGVSNHPPTTTPPITAEPLRMSVNARTTTTVDI